MVLERKVLGLEDSSRLKYTEHFQLVLLVVSRAPPNHTELYLSTSMHCDICSEADPGSEEQLQVYKRVEPPQPLCSLDTYNVTALSDVLPNLD